MCSGNAPPDNAADGHHAVSPSPTEVTAVLRFAAAYQPQLRALDLGRASEAEDALLVRTIVDSMNAHLGSELASRMDRYVKVQFKRNVKIIY